MDARTLRWLGRFICIVDDRYRDRYRFHGYWNVLQQCICNTFWSICSMSDQNCCSVLNVLSGGICLFGRHVAIKRARIFSNISIGNATTQCSMHDGAMQPSGTCSAALLWVRLCCFQHAYASNTILISVGYDVIGTLGYAISMAVCITQSIECRTKLHACMVILSGQQCIQDMRVYFVATTSILYD